MRGDSGAGEREEMAAGKKQITDLEAELTGVKRERDLLMEVMKR